MKTENTGNGTLETWTADEVSSAFERDEIILVDVRTPQEYMLEHIPGSLLLPMAEFKPEKLPAGADKPVILFCGSSKRSGKLAGSLLENGHETARHLEDGFAGWKKAEKPYATIDLPTGKPKTENADKKN